MRQKGFASVIVIILAALGTILAIYYFGVAGKPKNVNIQPNSTTKTAVASPTPHSESITSEQQCIKNGGEWKKVGPRPLPECSIKSKDAGKQCQGKNDCEGECLAPEGAKPREQAVGVCSDYSVYLGCYSTVENGTVSPVRCVD